MTVRVVYKGGAFIPKGNCEVIERTEGLVVVELPALSPPTIADAQERRLALTRLVDEMRMNTLPWNSPRFTREELHERR